MSFKSFLALSLIISVTSPIAGFAQEPAASEKGNDGIIGAVTLPVGAFGLAGAEIGKRQLKKSFAAHAKAAERPTWSAFRDEGRWVESFIPGNRPMPTRHYVSPGLVASGRVGDWRDDSVLKNIQMERPKLRIEHSPGRGLTANETQYYQNELRAMRNLSWISGVIAVAGAADAILAFSGKGGLIQAGYEAVQSITGRVTKDVTAQEVVPAPRQPSASLLH